MTSDSNNKPNLPTCAQVVVYNISKGYSFEAYTAEQMLAYRAQGRAEVREWAVQRWNAEVSNRPLVNTHRRSLDDTWRQIIRFTGGDPEELIGPSHDELLEKQNANP